MSTDTISLIQMGVKINALTNRVDNLASLIQEYRGEIELTRTLTRAAIDPQAELNRIGSRAIHKAQEHAKGAKAYYELIDKLHEQFGRHFVDHHLCVPLMNIYHVLDCPARPEKEADPS